MSLSPYGAARINLSYEQFNQPVRSIPRHQINNSQDIGDSQSHDTLVDKFDTYSIYIDIAVRKF